MISKIWELDADYNKTNKKIVNGYFCLVVDSLLCITTMTINLSLVVMLPPLKNIYLMGTEKFSQSEK